jgi:hypothetical protein
LKVKKISVNIVQSISLLSLPEFAPSQGQAMQLTSMLQGILTTPGSTGVVVSSLHLSDGSVVPVESSWDFKLTSSDTLVITVNESAGSVAAVDTGSGYLLRAQLFGDSACGALSVAIDYGYVAVRFPPPKSVTALVAANRIAQAGSAAAQLGIPSSVAVAVSLQYGDVVDMSIDRRTVFEVLPPLGIFTVSRAANGTAFVHGGAIAGTGYLRVSFTHINLTTTLTVTTVAAMSISISAHPFPSYPGSNNLTVNSLSAIGSSGVYEQVLLDASVLFSDGVGQNFGSSSAIVWALNPTGVIRIGGSAQLQNQGTPLGLAGQVTVTASVAELVSNNYNIDVTSEPVQVTNIFGMSFPSTLSGQLGQQYQVSFGAVLSDGWILPSSYLFPASSGLQIANMFQFASSNSISAPVNVFTGLVTLSGNSYMLENITIASITHNPVELGRIGFYCNLLPTVGDVDLGDATDEPIQPVSVGSIFTIPVRVDVGPFTLKLMQLELTFDSSLLSFVAASTGPSWLGGSLRSTLSSSGVVQIGGTSSGGISGTATVALVQFRAIAVGVAGISGSVGSLDDTSGNPIGDLQAFIAGNVQMLVKSSAGRRNVDISSLERRSGVECNIYNVCAACIPARPVGDVDGDCLFNSQDITALRIYMNALALSPGGILNETFSGQFLLMDADKNGQINTQDMNFLTRAMFSEVRFLSSLQSTSAGLAPACQLELSASLTRSTATGDQAADASDTAVFFWLQSTSPDFGSQLASSILLSGQVVPSVAPGILLEGVPAGNGVWSVSLASSLAVSFGTSVLAFTLDAAGQSSISRASFFFGSPTPPFEFQTPFVAGIRVSNTSAVDVDIQSTNPLLSLTDVVDSLACQAAKQCTSGRYIAVPATILDAPICRSITECNATQFQSTQPTATSDRRCATCRACAGASFIDQPCNRTSDTVCDALSTCAVGSQYEYKAPTLTTDRSCANCSSCAAGYFVSGGCDGVIDTTCVPMTLCTESQFELKQGTVTSDRVCVNITSCDRSSTFEVMPKTVTSDRLCANCTTCAASEYMAAPCALSANTQCVSCSSCRVGFEFVKDVCSALSDTKCQNCTSCERGVSFETSPCLLSANRVCSPCTSCGTDQYTARPCNPLGDSVCANYTACVADIQFEHAAITPTSNRICKPIQSCLSTSFVQEQPTQTSDRRCTPYSICNLSEYELVSATATSNRVCNPARVCLASEHQAVPLSLTSDRICTASTVCNASQFESVPASLTSNRVCDDLSVCLDSQFQLAEPTATSNRKCQPLTVCSGSSYENRPATVTSNRACTSISACDLDSNYVSAMATLTSDVGCTPLTLCNFAVQYLAAEKTVTTNNICRNITFCKASEYTAAEYTKTSDRVCLPYTTCRTGPSATIASICSKCELAIGGALPVTAACSNALTSACTAGLSTSYCPVCSVQAPNLNDLTDPCLRVSDICRKYIIVVLLLLVLLFFIHPYNIILHLAARCYMGHHCMCALIPGLSSRGPHTH